METPAPEVKAAEVVVVEEVKTEEKRERHRAVVTRIGTEPLLAIEGLGEFRFAYRNVKKKPGETRPYLNVGDEVECRLTKAAVPKAVSVRVVKKTQPVNTYVHNPYEVTVPENPSLFDFLGGADGIDAMVESVCLLPVYHSTRQAFDVCVDAACKTADDFITEYEEESFYPTKNVADDSYDCYTRYGTVISQRRLLRYNDEDVIILRQRSHSAPPVY